MGKYILSKVDNFELNYYSLFRLWFFQRYFLGYDYIYDFGCGSGFNLAMLAQMYPNTQLVGLDFVPSSVELAREIGNILDIYIDSYMFDLIQPNYSITIKKNSLVFTSGVIEQVASKFNEFLDYIIYNKPKLCIHIEPTIEMYENNLFDYLAIMFHKKRGYTVGYLPALQELEKQGKAEIIKVKRLYFGSLMMEGFTYIIWRPL
jgi:SAM-dependent methyltransferase